MKQLNNTIDLTTPKGYAKYFKHKFEFIENNIFVISKLFNQTCWDAKFKKHSFKYRTYFVMKITNEAVPYQIFESKDLVAVKNFIKNN